MPDEFNIPTISIEVNKGSLEKIADKIKDLEEVSNSYKKGFR